MTRSDITSVTGSPLGAAALALTDQPPLAWALLAPRRSASMAIVAARAHRGAQPLSASRSPSGSNRPLGDRRKRCPEPDALIGKHPRLAPRDHRRVERQPARPGQTGPIHPRTTKGAP